MRLEEIQPSNAAEQRVKRMKAGAKAATFERGQVQVP